MQNSNCISYRRAFGSALYVFGEDEGSIALAAENTGVRFAETRFRQAGKHSFRFNKISLMREVATRVMRVTAFCLPLFALLIAGNAYAQGLGEPVNRNGSFENTEPGTYTEYGIDGWMIEVDGSVPQAPAFEVVELEDAPDGDHALRIQVNDIGANAHSIQIVADSLHVVPGESYRLSVWARSDGPYGQASFTVGNYSYNEYGQVIRGVMLSDEWTEYSFDFTVTDAQTVIRAPLHFSYDGNIDYPVYIDDLRIVRTSIDETLARPVIVEAESGEVGSEFDVIEEGDVTFVRVTSDWHDADGQPQWSRPVSEDHVITYEVTFPAPGSYNLFARVRVNSQDQEGRGAADNDSFFFPDGFGEKQVDEQDDWSFVNQIDAAAGWSDPGDVVHDRGGAGAGVWKWINISTNTYHNEGFTYAVPEGELTQTFQIAGRETYLDIDKLAFAYAGLYFTVANLDAGEPGSLDWPTPPIPDPTGPPLADGRSKWLGSAHSFSQEPFFLEYWNQVTSENDAKWGHVEGTRGTYNWTNLDRGYNLARDNDLPYRFHVLVWGNQQPTWLAALTPEEQLESIEAWFEAVAERYPDIDYLEVVNEPLHDPPTCSHPGNQGDNCAPSGDYLEALGGTGETGWDWVLNAFRMARDIFPAETKLMINEYGILSSDVNVNRYLEIIELLQEEDLIDVIGIQGHAFSTRGTAAALAQRLDLLGATGLPIQVTEMDVDGNPNQAALSQEESDAIQLSAMQRIFPTLWSHPSVTGITMWGWRPGLWRTPQEANLVRANGEERPALQFVRDYIASWATSADVQEVAGSFQLIGNYPNPFNPTTTITYELATAADVRLDVYDILGRHVKSLAYGHQPAGNHAVVFDASGLSSGMYMYRLQSGGQAQTKRMLLIK